MFAEHLLHARPCAKCFAGIMTHLVPRELTKTRVIKSCLEKREDVINSRMCGRSTECQQRERTILTLSQDELGSC